MKMKHNATMIPVTSPGYDLSKAIHTLLHKSSLDERQETHFILFILISFYSCFTTVSGEKGLKHIRLLHTPFMSTSHIKQQTMTPRCSLS